ncbi:hypothetical protein [Streptomyces avicenniae]|uniref:hypothetical protein n=1 Tax=Streptomyces avicenniae TaxID=500153 RepID=UPI00069C3E0B|nr:hypothetical protein [Streptomyces avicenniae]
MTATRTLHRALLVGASATAAFLLTTTGSAVAGDLEPLEVQPYTAVPIDDGTVMGLLTEGAQNYVVSDPAYFDEAIETARDLTGDSLLPDSISVGTSVEDGETQLVTGAWRLAEIPDAIIIVPEGADWGFAAQIVHLPGAPGWGTYYFDADTEGGHSGLPTAYTVVAYDADGEVFDEVEVTPFP